MRQTGTSTRVLGTAAALLAALGTTLAASAALAAQSSAAANQDTSPTQSVSTKDSKAWSSDLWAAAARGDRGEFLKLLDHAPDRLGDPILAEAAEALGVAIGNHTTARLEKVAEYQEKVTTSLATLADVPEPAEREKALLDGLSAAIALHILADGMTNEKQAVLDDGQIKSLVAAADAEARAMEAEGRWYAAAEMFERLHALYEDDGAYLEDRQRQLKRLSLIAMYAPARNHELRSARLVENGEEPLPPFNPAGESVDERLEDVQPLMLLYALVNADRYHVSGSKMKDLLVSGLMGLRLLAQTEDLYGQFPQLADHEARSRFIESIASRSADLERSPIVTDQTLQQVVRDVQAWNRQTVRLPEALVLRVFGDGAMKALDDYTEIIWPYDVRQFERSTRGNFSGIGVSIQMNPKRQILVVTPLDGTPAQRAGVRAEDIISAVNGEATFGISLNQAVDKITGPKGTPVDITVERGQGDEKQEITFTIVRDTVELKTVKGWERVDATEDHWDWMIDPMYGIGYVRLTGFTENTTADFDKAVAEMQKQGLQGLILDLRFNRGGLLDQAVEITSRFVDYSKSRGSFGQVVVSTRNERTDGTGMRPEQLQRRSTPLPEIPIVVLINEGSASASEIVSGAIQDYAKASAARAVVLGQTSFGKGSVQNVLPIDPERRSSPRALMKLTTQYYVLPGGRMIHRVPGKIEHGVVPDMSVSMLPEKVAESLMLRQEADVLVLDEQGNPPALEDRPDPSRLITEGMDLQLNAALVLLQSQTRPTGAAAAMLPEDKTQRTP